jgi:hypothetical protein
MPTLYVALVYFVSYPSGFFDCQFHKSRHMTSKGCGALNPSSFPANVGSAVKSGTSPSLYPNDSYSDRIVTAMVDLPSANDFRLKHLPGGFTHRLHNLEDTLAPTCAEVECSELAFLFAKSRENIMSLSSGGCL